VWAGICKSAGLKECTIPTPLFGDGGAHIVVVVSSVRDGDPMADERHPREHVSTRIDANAREAIERDAVVPRTTPAHLASSCWKTPRSNWSAPRGPRDALVQGEHGAQPESEQTLVGSIVGSKASRIQEIEIACPCGAVGGRHIRR